MTTYINPDPRQPWPICFDAVELIARAEGLRLDAYQDVAGVWTIGRGHTGTDVRAGMTITLARADALFAEDINRTAQAVQAMLTGCATRECELGAMVSLAYNIGTAAFSRSTVLRAHRRGDREAAARAFALWNQATVNGRKVQVTGLVRRRAQEAALYMQSSTLDAARANFVVAPQSQPLASPIHQSGVVSIVSGGLGMAAAASGDVRTLAENLHINLGAVCAAVSLVVGAVVIYWRWKQREGGWA